MDGKPGRCPLCKGELIVARYSQTTYRLTQAARPQRAVGQTGWLSGGAAAILLVLGVFYLGIRNRSDRHPSPDRPAEVVHFAPVKLPPAEPVQRMPRRPTPEPPAPVAVAKPQSAAAPIKPEPAQASAIPSRQTVVVPARPAGQDVRAPEHDQMPPSLDLSPEHLIRQLRQVPEVALDPDREKAKNEKDAEAHLRKLLARIQKQTDKDADGFVKHLEKSRPDLAGLPLRKGKDRQLRGEQAKGLAMTSLLGRCALAASLKRARHDSDAAAQEFWSGLAEAAQDERTRLDFGQEMTLRGLEQLLQIESAATRLPLVRKLRAVPGKAASVQLARCALFDLDRQVRAEALAALKGRPEAEYAEVLLEGFRYPWAPVAARAVEAISSLGLKDGAARLIDLLNEPDPGEPFLQTMGDRPVVVRRELVRVNHHHNCLLCHAPAGTTEKANKEAELESLILVPAAPIPVPCRKLPTVADYLTARDHFIFVRADITYLRQDFSVLQTVDNPGKWPARQRFDYLVRTRPLTAKERAEWEEQKKHPRPPSFHRQAVLDALGCLARQEARTPARQSGDVAWGASSGDSRVVRESPSPR
jgi:hypothetical protein